MDSKKMFLSWFLMLLWICSSSWVSEGFDFGQVLSVVKGGIDGGGGDNSLPCIQKLLPCQPYLKAVPSSPPPATCCEPLKEMITGDSGCLCQIFNNPVLLKNFNLTQEEALKLPKACGANADISVCKNEAAAPGGSPATPTTPRTSSNGSSTSNNTSNTNTNSTATASAAAANIGGPSSTVNLIIMLVAAAAAIFHK